MTQGRALTRLLFRARRLSERLAEWVLLAGYVEDRHESHYRRLMKARAIVRGWAGTSLTNSVEEGAEVYRRVRPFLDLATGDRVLDFGCGIGGVGIHLAREVGSSCYVGVDISPEAIARAQVTFAEMRGSRLLAIEAVEDIQALGPFEVVFAQSVFTHNPPSVLKRFLGVCSKVVTPNGKLYVTFAVGEQATRMLRTDFIYSENEIVALASDAGWVCRRVDGWEHPTHRERLAAGAPIDTLFLLTRSPGNGK